MVKLGDPAPDFAGTTTVGEPFLLSALRGRPVVLYFFPKAFTPGCTREAAGFRDAYPEIRALGAEVVGISTDDQRTQCEFAAKMSVPFPMIGDHDGQISRRYDVLWPFFGIARRVTFVVDAHGMLRAVFQHELRVGQHVPDVLNALKRVNHPRPV
ncbi:MAG: peroxiredoxin [Myxococcaceae bacterium]